jgi:hypothetical protein
MSGCVFSLRPSRPWTRWAACAALACGAQTAGAAALEQTAPSPTVYLEETDFLVMGMSAVGTVTAPLQAVDLQLGPGNLATSGCEASDFATFVPGSIALLQRGVCTFEVKAENAAAAGALGALIFNQGNTPDRLALFAGTLGMDYTGGIPVLSLSYDLGVMLASTFGAVVFLEVTDADFAVVPEPPGWALFGLGLLALSVRRRAC